MDTRNYNEPDNCGLEACDCRDDNTCGCTFPNNMSDFSCTCTDEGKCGQFDQEKTNQYDSQFEQNKHIKKDTVCFCTPEECDCTFENSETNN